MSHKDIVDLIKESGRTITLKIAPAASTGLSPFFSLRDKRNHRTFRPRFPYGRQFEQFVWPSSIVFVTTVDNGFSDALRASPDDSQHQVVRQSQRSAASPSIATLQYDAIGEIHFIRKKERKRTKRNRSFRQCHQTIICSSICIARRQTTVSVLVFAVAKSMRFHFIF